MDERIAAVAETQGGVVSRAQLLAIGVSRDAVGRRVRAGKLHRVHAGVYAVGHGVLGQSGREWAAVLATGGVLSHRSAGAKLGVITWNGRPEITTTRGRRAPRGVIAHSARALHPDDVALDAESTASRPSSPPSTWATTSTPSAPAAAKRRRT